MHIQFNSIRFKNFLQVGSEFEAFSLGADPFTVIVGANGSGKSTILDALTYVLFKKPYRKIKLGQLINNTNRKGMVVEIAFTIGNNKYVVRRGEKPKLFEIFVNKQLLEVDPTVGDYQKYLEEVILRQDYKTFCQINVIGKAKYVQFMELDASYRRTVVEDLLDANIYTVMQSIAKSKVKTLKEQFNESSTAIQILQSKIDTTTRVMESFDRQKEADLLTATSELESLEYKLSHEVGTLESQQAAVDELKVELEAVIPEKHRTAFQERKRNVDRDIGALNSIVDRCDKLIEKVDQMTECPHCMQIVDDGHKEAIVKENNLQILTSMGQLQDAQEKLAKFDRIEDQFKQTERSLRSALESLSQSKQRISNFENLIDRQKKRIGELEQSSIPELPDVEELRSELVTVTNQYDNINKEINKYNKALKRLGDDGIKASLVQKYIPIINKTINEYLEKMQMFVEFNLDSEFNETIDAVNRDLFTYHSFSEGQRMRVDLAILLTWRHIAKIRSSMSTNLFILDEIADGSLDDAGMVDFMDILKSIADTQNTIIISHKDSTIDLFDKVIRAKTEGNFSSYARE